jgi:hypothetical protein
VFAEKYVIAISLELNVNNRNGAANRVLY